MRLLTIYEVAEYLKVSSQMIRNLIKERILSFYYVGRLIRIDEKDVEDYLNMRRIKKRITK